MDKAELAKAIDANRKHWEDIWADPNVFTVNNPTIIHEKNAEQYIKLTGASELPNWLYVARSMELAIT